MLLSNVLVQDIHQITTCRIVHAVSHAHHVTEPLTLSLRETPATCLRKLISAACIRDLILSVMNISSEYHTTYILCMGLSLLYTVSSIRSLQLKLGIILVYCDTISTVSISNHHQAQELLGMIVLIDHR